MVRNHRRPRAGLVAFLAFIASMPFLFGQGCGSNNIEPLPTATGPLGIVAVGTTIPVANTGNTPPEFTFFEPLSDISREVGAIVNISWLLVDPDSNASIQLILDPDGTYGNGNEIVVLPLALENDTTSTECPLISAGGSMTFCLDTLSLVPHSYRIIARVNDGVNPEVTRVASGNLLLFGAGLLPGNIAPKIQLTQPTTNVGASQNDVINISYCPSDPDDGEKGIVPDVLLLLDVDSDPNNDVLSCGNCTVDDCTLLPTLSDIDPAKRDILTRCTTALCGRITDARADNDTVCTVDDREAMRFQICTDALPRTIKGPPIGSNPHIAGTHATETRAIIVGCFKDTDCTNINNASLFALTVDVGLIPPTVSGDPYQIRGTIWDHTNLPVHSYALGNLSITAFGSGVVSLSAVGRTVSGTKFLGFDAGQRAGSFSVEMGDIDGDGAGDFVIVSRFGRPGGGKNVGSAHIIFGRKGEKFGSEIPLNSIGTQYRGSLLVMDGSVLGTEGIISAARVADQNGDNKPELIIGMPYVEEFSDNQDDDPWDCSPFGCYVAPTASGTDEWPNPLSTPQPPEDGVGAFDSREALGCTNDLDVNRITPLNGGYAIILGSQNTLDSGVIGLGSLGQAHEAPSSGFRFRGAWYPPEFAEDFDYSQTTSPIAQLPFNRFGQTVNTMPDMTSNTLSSASPRSGTTLLISSPMGALGRGRVFYFVGRDYMTSIPQPGNSESSPYFTKGPGICPVVSRFAVFPNGWDSISGAAIGDELGYAAAAGDYNLDGSQDILCGAPGADRNGIVDGGIVYIIFGRPDFSPPDLSLSSPPRMEIRGIHSGDQFGALQTIVGDVNHDGLPDIGFAAQFADGPGGVDAGYVGVVFGGRRLTGENIFSVNQVGTSQLPGTNFYGSQAGGHAGAVISNVGDFNGDGTDDLLICAPDETRTFQGQLRRGVAYLIFGGAHWINQSFNLSQVGTSVLPGIVFVTPYAVGSADEANIDWAGSVGDVNGDGFADILLGVSTADYVNPLEPSQRRVDSGEAYLIYGSNTGTNTLGK